MVLKQAIYYSSWIVLSLCGKTQTATFLSFCYFVVENTCVSSIHGVGRDQDPPASHEQS